MVNADGSIHLRNGQVTKPIIETRSIDSGHGQVSVCYARSGNRLTRDCFFIAHGVKGSMNSSLVSYFHEALAMQGFLSVKFNFPYTEGRMRLLRKPDKRDVLVECYRRVVESARKSQWKPQNLFLGGVSLGAAVASHVVADGTEIPGVKGLLFFSYPIHRPGRPEVRGDQHLHKISKPMLFIAGTKDVYAERDALRATISSLGTRARVHWVEGANHAFNKHKGRAIYSKTLREIVETITEWVNSIQGC